MISLVINIDTRPGTGSSAMGDGVRSSELRLASVANKINFLKGFKHEVIVFVDEHEPLSRTELDHLKAMSNVLVVRKHSNYYRGEDPFRAPNDLNYLEALSLARGTHILHCDQDCAAFARDEQVIHDLLKLTEEHAFVCYPSPVWPRPLRLPVKDPSYGERQSWASTRFFLCKTEWVGLRTLRRAIENPDWFWDSLRLERRHDWTEHFLAASSGWSTHYPKWDADHLMVWCWEQYKEGTLSRLNQMPYDQVKAQVDDWGGVSYHGVQIGEWI